MMQRKGSAGGLCTPTPKRKGSIRWCPGPFVLQPALPSGPWEWRGGARRGKGPAPEGSLCQEMPGMPLRHPLLLLLLPPGLFCVHGLHSILAAEGDALWGWEPHWLPGPRASLLGCATGSGRTRGACGLLLGSLQGSFPAQPPPLRSPFLLSR